MQESPKQVYPACCYCPVIHDKKKLPAQEKLRTFGHEPEMTTDPQPLIEIRDLHVFFDKERRLHGLKGICLQIPKGKVTALIGASGSGKSVTSLALMGLLPRQTVIEGSIRYGHQELLALDPSGWKKIRGKDFAMIFQEPMSALNPLISCGKQLMEAALAHQDIPKKKAKALATAWLQKVQIPHPEKAFDKYPHEMSGGQKQRVMIAMAMINQPQLLIADEPSTALDVLVQKEIVHLIQKLVQEHRTTVLFITHDLALAQHISDQVVEMKDGKITDRSLYTKEIPLKVPEEKKHTPVLQVENVSVAYHQGKDTVLAADKVHFELYEGETLGLIGGSGSGKTTVSKAILGLIPVRAGKIIFRGKDITHLSKAEWRKLRTQVQIIFQDPFASLNPRIRIGEAISEPMTVHFGLSQKEAKEATISLLLQVDLSPTDFNKYPHEFSGGQRQRICIARALALNPSLIICDESVAALDIHVQEQILALLMRLQKEKNLTYLFITHDINVVKKVCDRVIVMQNGSIVEEGSLSGIIGMPRNPYTQALINAVPHE
ncbi:MAG: ABC transporter ATP-binding protein [Taibaiella sp.]|nr:ABC transporter ATP-binding protein [Taibaiella sp.]